MMNGNNGSNRNSNNGGGNNYGGIMSSNEFQNETSSLSYLDEKTANKDMEDSLKNATVDKKIILLPLRKVLNIVFTR